MRTISKLALAATITGAIVATATPAHADTVSIWSTDSWPDGSGAQAYYTDTTRTFKVCDIDGDGMSAIGYLSFTKRGGGSYTKTLRDSNGANNSCPTFYVSSSLAATGTVAKMKICRIDGDGANKPRDCRETGGVSI